MHYIRFPKISGTSLNWQQFLFRLSMYKNSEFLRVIVRVPTKRHATNSSELQITIRGICD